MIFDQATRILYLYASTNSLEYSISHMMKLFTKSFLDEFKLRAFILTENDFIDIELLSNTYAYDCSTCLHQ